ncbi:hypothetical protein RJT34_31284 [Clitoria ternatea]|uniref:Uncharacterized protein n=1 Tax=Clitoria ternatea TaxID=43366 RepID=A0AAN9EW24_CLITE
MLILNAVSKCRNYLKSFHRFDKEIFRESFSSTVTYYKCSRLVIFDVPRIFDVPGAKALSLREPKCIYETSGCNERASCETRLGRADPDGEYLVQTSLGDKFAK